MERRMCPSVVPRLERDHRHPQGLSFPLGWAPPSDCLIPEEGPGYSHFQQVLGAADEQGGPGLTTTGLTSRVSNTASRGWGSSQAGGRPEAENCWEVSAHWEVRCEEGSALLPVPACTCEAGLACPGICFHFIYFPEINCICTAAGTIFNFAYRV